MLIIGQIILGLFHSISLMLFNEQNQKIIMLQDIRINYLLEIVKICGMVCSAQGLYVTDTFGVHCVQFHTDIHILNSLASLH